MRLRISEKYLQLLLNGTKNYEGRFNHTKYSNLRIGDQIELVSPEKKCRFTLSAIEYYDTIEEMLLDRGVYSMLGITSLDAGIKIYQSFHKYEKPDLEGMLAFRLENNEKITVSPPNILLTGSFNPSI